jgi:acyl-CoA synthetase (AMP-forming)/AMP-acid ligase II
VIDFAKSRLTPYKVPKSVEFVDRIPRSEATKVNRAALAAERQIGTDRTKWVGNDNALGTDQAH